jgi:ABC-type branched-subunit amino acid transport system substrate-binding protein
MASCFRQATSLLGLLAIAGQLACSAIGKADFEECETNADCREAFGIGAVCGGDGLCSDATPSPRCKTTFPEDLFSRPEKYRDAVVLGSLMDRSSTTHAARERSSRLAALQVDAEGGIDGHQVAIVYCTYEENLQIDSLKASDAALASARYLAEVLGVPAILGPAGSGDTSAVYQALRGKGTLVMSPSATSPALTDLDPPATDENPGLLWRTAPPDTLQGPVIAADMSSRGVTDVFLIAQEGAYGEGLSTVFQESFSGSVVVRLFSTENERTARITEAATATASEILFISSTQADVIAFLNAANQNPGYASKTFFLTDSAANKEVIDESPSALFARIRGTRPTPVNAADPVFNNFRGGYASEYGEDVTAFSFTAHMYDAAWLVFAGSAWSTFREGGVTGRGIAKGLRKISSGKAFDIQPLSWGGIAQSFRSGSGIDVRGASGDLNYDPVTEETTAAIQVWVIGTGSGGEFEIQPG